MAMAGMGMGGGMGGMGMGGMYWISYNAEISHLNNFLNIKDFANLKLF